MDVDVTEPVGVALGELEPVAGTPECVAISAPGEHESADIADVTKNARRARIADRSSPLGGLIVVTLGEVAAVVDARVQTRPTTGSRHQTEASPDRLEHKHGPRDYGKLNCSNWKHDDTPTATLAGARASLITVTTSGGSKRLLHGFNVDAEPDGNPGSSAVAIDAIDGDLTLRDTYVLSRQGAHGEHGTDHPPSMPAANGPSATSGGCTAAPIAGVGGVNSCQAGASTITVSGGNGVGNCTNNMPIGGNPGAGPNAGAGGTVSGLVCNNGMAGGPGLNGSSAAIGADGVGVLLMDGWIPSAPSNATEGTPGSGGGSGATCASGASGGGGAGGAVAWQEAAAEVVARPSR